MTKTINTIIAAFTLGWMGVVSVVSAADSEVLELVWSVETGKAVNIAPLVVGSRAVVISTNNRTIAFGIKKGKTLWEYKPREGVWDWGLTSDGSRIFVCLKGGGLSALNSIDGAEIWKINIGIDCQRPPLITGNTLYVPTTFVGPDLKGSPLTGAKLFSINSSNGSINWAFTTSNYILQTPLEKDGTVFVGGSYIDPNIILEEGGPSRFYALDSKTGQPKWSSINEDGLVKALYINENRLVFVSYQDFVTALDTSNGKLVWKRDTENWVQSLKGLDGVVYFGSANTIVHAWNTLDGKVRWRLSMKTKSFDYMMGKPVFIGDRLYFLSQKRAVFAIDFNKGKILWTQQTEGKSSRVGLSASKQLLFIGDSSGRLSAYRILK